MPFNNNLIFISQVRYLQEYQPLGTAGGLYHFRDQISSPDSSAIVVIHADIFCVLPLKEMLELFREKNDKEVGSHVVLGTRVHQVGGIAYCVTGKRNTKVPTKSFANSEFNH